MPLLQYLHSTCEMSLHLNSYDLNIVHWWFNASYGICIYLNGCTGATMSIGRVCFTGMSKKQKINTTSFTQGEIVREYDASQQMMWTQYLMSNQVFDIDKSILYHDIKSTIMLEENGCESSSRRTNHITIRYLYIKDYINIR